MRASDENFTFAEFEKYFDQIQRIAKKSRSPDTIQQWESFLKKRDARNKDEKSIDKHFSLFVNGLSAGARSKLLRLKSDAAYESTRVRISLRKETIDQLNKFIDEENSDSWSWDKKIEYLMDRVLELSLMSES